MSRLEAALEREGERLAPEDLDSLEERCRTAWEEGRFLLTIHTLDLARLVRATLDRDEAIATASLDREVWRRQAEAAMRERDEARADVAYLRGLAESWQGSAADLAAEMERLRALRELAAREDG